MHLARPIVWIAVFLTGAMSAADELQQKKDPGRLTVQRIYGSKELESESKSFRWLDDSSAYVTLENSEEASGGRDIVGYTPQDRQRTVLVPAADLIPPGETAPLKIDGYTFSKDMSLVLIYTNSKRVWRRNTRGDYWILDRSSRQLTKLGQNARPSSLMFAKLSPTGKHAAYVYDRSIYVEGLLDDSVVCVAKAENGHIINGTFDWVYEEELGLRDGFRWSPDGKSIAYWQINTQGVRQVPLVNNTDALYPKVTWLPYPKVGQRNSASRIGVVSCTGGETKWIDIPGDPREHYLARMDWAENNDELLVQQLNRLQNTNRVMLCNVRSGEVETILTERDEAWVDVHDELMWLDDGKQFTWISERDGWRRVYLVSRDGKNVRLVTPGEFDVIELLHVDEDADALYFIASPDNPGQRFLYRVRTDGTELTRVTPVEHDGMHDYHISPDGRWAICTSSSFDQPPMTALIDLPQHSRRERLVKNKKLRKKVAKLDRQPAEFFRVEIGDGVELDAWCLKPPDFDASQKYPLLVYVYGEPAGQTVADGWGGSGALWHFLLAQRGYVVMSFDNRGTKSPRGREWRKSIYRRIGTIGPQDQAAALKAVLKSRPYLDPQRVGVWGWSGGGSSSLHAIFKYPDLYHTAIAVAPVPNQRYYDTIYQERYMGLPATNVDGFRQGSPINFAHQLRGNLLLIHGTGDDNCHYQTTELLINELIRHNKPFQMFAYPNRTHPIREGKNTTLHLRTMMTRFLLEKLPPGPRPASPE